MIVTQTDILPVTVLESTLVIIRETNSFTRLFTFRNVAAGQLSFKFQESTDGGQTWVDLGVVFPIETGQSSTQVPASSNLLRILVSGLTDPYGVELTYTRYYEDATYVWTSPVV